MRNPEYDAIVAGSGPNGLSAAVVLQQQGLSVLLVEGNATVGGGMRYVLGPFRFPVHPLKMAQFGLKALQPLSLLEKRFKGTYACGLFAGMGLLPCAARFN